MVDLWLMKARNWIEHNRIILRMSVKFELYAIIHALKKWHHYLYGAQFEIVFDHESIKWFPNQMDLKGRKARWAEILQEYDCQLRYCKGRYNVVADALSQMPEINSLSFTELKSEFLESL